MIYPATTSEDIGSLLRLIQEEKAQTPMVQPPVSQPGATMREVVQAPLQGPESPGTSRVVSERPEAVIGPQAPASMTEATPARSSVGPVAIGTPGILPAVVPPSVQIAPNPTTGSAEGDWATYHANEGVMPIGYAGEGGGQPRGSNVSSGGGGGGSAPVAQPSPSPAQTPVRASTQPATKGAVLGTQIKSGGGINLSNFLNAAENQQYFQNLANMASQGAGKPGVNYTKQILSGIKGRR